MFGEALARELEIDSGSEIDNEELYTEQELQDLLEDVANDEEETEIADEIAQSINIQNFTWEQDYESFLGQREDFQELSGPKIEGTAPIDIFTQIWDQTVMDLIVEQTNLYAWQTIAAASETRISAGSRINDWVETTPSEIYRIMAILILMAVCYRSRIDR